MSLHYKFDIRKAVSISETTASRFEGEIVGNFCISTLAGDMVPPPFLPFLREKRMKNLDKSFRIQDVDEIDQDPVYELYSHAFHDPTIKAILDTAEHDGEDVSAILQGVDIVSDRNVLRKIIKSCLKLPAHNFYCEKKDFALEILKVRGKIFLQSKDRFETQKGGFGSGFFDEMVDKYSLGENVEVQEEVMKTATFYRIIKTTVNGLTFITRFQVDALDEEDNVVELKSRKIPNPRYPLGEDFFLNIWSQMCLSSTKYVVIGFHDKGVVRKLEKYSISEIQAKAKLTERDAKQAIVRLTHFFRWLQGSLADAENGSDRQEAILQYDLARDEYMLRILDGVERGSVLSEEIEARL